MSTLGQFSSKNPTIKRILKEAAELAGQPSADYHAAPLESDLFEWHFTIRGPPAPSPFEGGMYHGRIVLPPAYPLKPPSFRFLTASGRFEVNREICLSISGHHEETWQPAWGIRTALVAIRSFMDTSAGGQLGGMEAGDETRRRLAAQSPAFRCPTCSKANIEILQEQEALVKEQGESAAPEEVPEQLRLAYREDLSKTPPMAPNASGETTPAKRDQEKAAGVSPAPDTIPAPVLAPTPTRTVPVQAAVVPPIRVEEAVVPAWIDKAIYAVLGALVFLLGRKLI